MRARLRWAASLVTVLLLAFGSLLAQATPASAAPITLSAVPSSSTAPGSISVTASVSVSCDVDDSSCPSAPGSIDVTVTLPDRTTADVPGDSVTTEDGGTTTTTFTGRVTAGAPGSYTITASAEGHDTASRTVTFTAPPPPIVTLTQDSTVSETGSTLTLTASAANAGNGFWNIDVISGPNEQNLAEGRRGSPITVSYRGGARTGTDVIRASWHRDDEQSAQGEVSHGWIGPPAGVSVSVSPGTGSSLVGGTLGVTVTVSGGEGRGNGSLALDVNGVALPFTGSEGTFSAEYQGTAVRLDTITATWTDEFGSTSGSAKHTWTAPRVEVSDPTGGSDLGETATVTVDLPDGSLDGTVAVAVLSGPHAGSLDVTGQGSASYRGTAPGTDSIQASLETRFGTFTSRIVTKSWSTPVVTLSQDASRSALGAVHTVTATTSGTTESSVAFAVSGTNAGASVDVAGTHPTFTGTYAGDKDGADVLTATATVFGRTYTSSGLSHTWVRPTVTVNQDLETSRPGQTVLLTAAVIPAGTPGTVTFRVEGVGPPLTLSDDGSDGSYTASYTRDDEGTDTIKATFSSGNADFGSGPIQHVWDDESVPAAVLSPAGATNCVGSSFTPTVTLVDGDDPLAGVAVQVMVSAPGAPDQVLSATTDVDGRATVSYAAAAPGTDTLVAAAVVDSETVTSAPLTHAWEACELLVSVAPAGTTSLAGSSFTPTVSVRDPAGAPVADATVDVTVTMVEQADQPVVSVRLTTNGDGLASTTYDRPVEGTDRIHAVVTSGARTGRATIDHFWRVQEDLRVTLGPAGTASLAGSDFTATALVTDGETPVPGAQVAFRATLTGQEGAPQEDITLEAVTDEDGQASFTFTRPVAGTDTILAEATVGDRSGRASVVHQWDLVPGLTFTIEPPGTSSRLDEQFTTTATVLVDDVPVPDVEVAFVATQQGQGDRSGTARTGADGRADFTYTRDTVGTDLVTATVLLADGRRGTAAMTHLWRSGDQVTPPPPEPPSVEARGVIVPAGLASVVGTGCPRLAPVLVLVDGEQVATTRAGRDGTYQTDVRLPAGLTVGQYPLEARCEPVMAKNEIAVVAPASTSGTAGAQAATAIATFSFFVLLGGQLVKGAGGYSAGGG